MFGCMEWGLGAIRPAFSRCIKQTLQKIAESWKVFELSKFGLTTVRSSLSNQLCKGNIEKNGRVLRLLLTASSADLRAIRPAFNTCVKKTFKKTGEFWKVFESMGLRLTDARLTKFWSMFEFMECGTGNL